MDYQPIILLGNSLNLSSVGKTKIMELAPNISTDNINLVTHNETASIGVDLIKEVILESSRSSLTGNTKAYIVDEAHRLTEEAQNTLLKILEEPPADTIFVLTTNNLDLILPTVASRCRVILDNDRQVATEDFEDVGQLLAYDPFKRLEGLVGQIDVKEMITKTQKYLQSRLRDYSNNPKETRTCIESLVLVENSRQMIEANVAKDAVWESLMLNLPKISTNL